MTKRIFELDWEMNRVFSYNEWMLEFIQETFFVYGYWLLFFSSLLEGVIVTGLFVPGGLIVLLGGYFAKTSTLVSFWFVVLLSWIGMFLGDVVNYYFGKGIWHRFFEKSRFVQRFSRIYIFGQEARMRKLLAKYGTLAIFYAHLVGALRSTVGFFAGMSGFSIRRYLIASCVASLVWSLLFTAIGYFVAEATSDLRDLNGTITFLALGLLLLILLLRGVFSLFVTFFTSRYVVRRAYAYVKEFVEEWKRKSKLDIVREVFERLKQ